LMISMRQCADNCILSLDTHLNRQCSMSEAN